MQFIHHNVLRSAPLISMSLVMSVEFKLCNFFISSFERPINFEFSSLLKLFVFLNTVSEQTDRRSLILHLYHLGREYFGLFSPPRTFRAINFEWRVK